MKKKTFTVGVFDSGVGGLNLLRACLARATGVRYLYYGDNRHAPYGAKSAEEVLSYVRSALKYFKRKGADAVVLACNTATALTVDRVRNEFPFPVIGMEPALKPAAKNGGTVLVLATPNTINSPRLKLLAGRFPDCSFVLHSCPRLARAIEKNLTEGEPFLLAAHLNEGKYSGVVLGCTHYIFCKKQIEEHYACPVFDGVEGTVNRLFSVLKLLKIGRADHHSKMLKMNMCSDYSEKNQVKFVGKCRKLNKTVYFRTFVSQKSEKNFKKVRKNT